MQNNNLYINPAWYDKLDNDFKKNFSNLICNSIIPENHNPTHQIIILDNISQHMNIDSFKIKTYNL